MFGICVENQEAYDAAVKRNIRDNAQKTWCATYADHEAIEAFISRGRISVNDKGVVTYAQNFLGSLAHSFDTKFKLTPNQVEAVRKMIAQTEARRAEWSDERAASNSMGNWVGKIGSRMTMTLTIKKIMRVQLPDDFDTPAFMSIVIFENSDQNTLIYKGSVEFDVAHEGKTVDVAFTPKSHGVRNGIKQTLISRPKLKEM